MLFNLLFTLAATALVGFGAPVPLSMKITDVNVLQFALTLEHLESAFYMDALSKYDEQSFEADGFPPWVRGRVSQIAAHEAEHVTFLSSALGDNATKPCTYSFPHTDPKSFIALSMVLETVGGSAYIGAAKLIEDGDTLTAAASILATESRHSGWLSSAVLKEQPWTAAFETPLLPSGAYSLAAQFITSCPSSNPALPVQQHPKLLISNATPVAGQQVTFQYDHSAASGGAFVVWLDGLDVVYSDLDGSGNTVVPEGLTGTVYAAVVSSNTKGVSDETLVTGFAVAQFPFSSFA